MGPYRMKRYHFRLPSDAAQSFGASSDDDVDDDGFATDEDAAAEAAYWDWYSSLSPRSQQREDAGMLPMDYSSQG